MHLQITDLTFTLDEEEVEKVCTWGPARGRAQYSAISISPHAWL